MRERTVEVEGIPTWVRERPGDGAPVVFWHGNPTDADDWIPFMKQLDRQSFAADMPGFGRSAAPGKEHFDSGDEVPLVGPLVGAAAAQARSGLGLMPGEYRARIKRNWARKEMRDAVLALYRSAPTAKLDAVGAGLEKLSAPALFLWSNRDPYIGIEDGRRMAARMPNATFEEISNAGHWPWIDRPELIDRAVEFLS